jgi:hypothetical protein
VQNEWGDCGPPSFPLLVARGLLRS